MAKRSAIDVFIDDAKRAHISVANAFSRKATIDGVLLSYGKEIFQVAQSNPTLHTNSVEVTGALHLGKVPYKRRTTPKDREAELNILMDSKEIYKFDGPPAKDNSFLYKSSVRIRYYHRKHTKIGKEFWETRLSVRYDFDHAYDAHPLFHAHFLTGELESDVRPLFKGVPNDIQKINHVIHSAVRIPSANVVGASALLIIAADHLPTKTFTEYLQAIRSQKFFREWRCDCSSLDHEDSARGLLSTGWYSSK